MTTSPGSAPSGASAVDREVVVIAPLVPVSVGDQFPLGAIPVHLTVLPKVRVPLRMLSSMVTAIGDVAADTAPFSVTTAEFDLLGQSADVPVTTVGLSAPLRQLHLDLLRTAGQAGAVPLQPTYHGDGYRPHITHTHDGQAVDGGASVELTSLALLDCSRPTRCIAAVWSMRSTSSAPAM